MNTFFSFFTYVLFQGLGLALILLSVALFIFWSINKFHTWRTATMFALLAVGWLLVVVIPVGMPSLLNSQSSLHTYGPGEGPTLHTKSVMKFLRDADEMKKVEDIAYDPTNIPPAITRTEPATVEINIISEEVVAEMAPGVLMNYWTFGGTVPGPFLRVREGDTIKLTLSNDKTSIHHHNIDLHAVTGPGGGAVITNVAPGESKTAVFKALNPGLYVYHCAHPNVATHMAHGMYGLILVEPEGGLSQVDREFYMMQGEFYAKGPLGKKGMQIFDAQEMLDGKPEYIVFNGRVGGTVGKMNAQVGETVRVYVGNGGVNLVSSFHAIGEIFDTVYPEAAIGSEPHKNIQTTLVPAGGASIVEFGLEVPGRYIFVDHALARLDRGAWGTLDVTGEENPAIFFGTKDEGGENGH